MSLSTKLRQARDAYQQYGARFLAREAFDFTFLRSPLFSRLSRAAYWKCAPAVYRRLYETDFDEYRAPLDPFKVEYVDLSRIEQITARPYPPWLGLERQFGTVRDGDWDKQEHRRCRQGIDENDARPESSRYLVVADRFSDSIMHRSMVDHFENGTPWEETELVRKLLWMVESGTYIYALSGCRSTEDVLRRYRSLDSVYESIQESGYLTQAELFERDPKPDMDFLDLLKDEILVDVGRTGELLFVDGRHRLSIAKILDLDYVPVAFVVRHAGWMEQRDERYANDGPFDHPDLRRLGPREERRRDRYADGQHRSTRS